MIRLSAVLVLQPDCGAADPNIRGSEACLSLGFDVQGPLDLQAAA